MKIKKEYVVPEVKSIKLEPQITLLDCSEEVMGEGCEAAYAPDLFKQDPLA